jgi:DNA-binding NtrC family response regulator
MIVEQDLDFGMKLADWLATHGYQPVFVRTVDAAIAELSSVRPQAIFVGLSYAEPAARFDMSKVSLLIRTECPRAPVITMVHEASQAQTQVMFHQGGCSFPVKPGEFAQIGHMLQSALSAATA